MDKRGDIIRIDGVSPADIPSDIKDSEVEILLTDSRNLRKPETSLFFAIRTAGGNDGHRFMKELYENGVRKFVVQYIPEDFPKENEAVIVQVKDTVEALRHTGEIAKELPVHRLAITGSRGKTTLKEWLFQLMSPMKKISRSPRSYNSKIGVPLSMWQLQPETEIAFIEAGISMEGEMGNLRDLIEPQTVIFTNIGDAHAEGFSSKEEKAREKAILAGGKKTKRIIYNSDDKILSEALRQYFEGKETIGWSLKNPQADLYLFPEDENLKDKVVRKIKYKWKGEFHELTGPFGKAEDLENAAGALALMLAEGFSTEEIAQRFGKLQPVGTRLNVTEGINGCSVIFDSFTSDVSSLQPVIDIMHRRKMPEQTMSIIMSDLMHESSSDNEAYRRIAEIVKENVTGKFIGIGSQMLAHCHLFPSKSIFFASTEDFLETMSASDFSDEILLIKGAPDFGFNRILDMLEVRRHETVLEVNLDSLVRNYNFFRSRIPRQTGIIAMVKASGYGAGSHEIAKTLQDCGASYLAVAVLDEGIELRKKGIRMPIMVMNPKSANYGPMFSNRLEPEIYTLGMLKDVVKEAKKRGVKDFPIHLKLDTGMHRMGLLPYELPDVIEIINSQDNVRICTAFSHLATADCLDMDDYTLSQLNLFEEMTTKLRKGLAYDFKKHILNSAGILRFPEYHHDYVRLGIGLYGADTLPPEIEPPLSPVSTLRTVIIAIRERKEGETIGYGRKGLVKKTSRIATIPIGYADGMNRHFGNGNIKVKVNGKDAPTIGNICMDACMIDVTDIDCKEGDSVEIFGREASLQRLADTLGTIPYEILTAVSPRVKRVYYRE